MDTLVEIIDELGYEWVYSSHEERLYLLAAEEVLPDYENGFPICSFSDLEQCVKGPNAVAEFDEKSARKFLNEARPLFSRVERR